MTIEEWKNLKEGDIIIRVDSTNKTYYTVGKEYIVVMNNKTLSIKTNQDTYLNLDTYKFPEYFKIKTPETIDKWWESCQKGDLIMCIDKPIPNPEGKEDHRHGGGGFISNKIFEVDYISDNKSYAIIWIKNEAGVYSNNCFPIKVQLPTEGKLPIDELGNWKFIQEYLKASGRREANSGLKDFKYIVWNNGTFNYWKSDGNGLPTVSIKDCIKPLVNQKNSSTNYNLKLKSNGSREISESKVFKINRLVPTITTGLRPTGNVSRGRVRKTTITIRHLSNKASFN